MSDLRPISLCSVLYKIVSKVLSARLKKFLPDIVSEAQGAFMSRRLISDNILIAHEMVHALRTNLDYNEDFMAIKTNMSKAYDKVEWDILKVLFKKLGFDDQWAKWVMACIRSVSFYVLVNGNSFGFISPKRGRRQGDPISHFIFILRVEVLVHVINKVESEKRLIGLRLTKKCPSVQHLLFVDDSLFLCKTNFKDALEIMRCPKIYGDLSRQEINFQKSSITFGKKLEPHMRWLMGVVYGDLERRRCWEISRFVGML
ncbi:putative mitochondrial protein [Cardamine amara subsp. amara]|uniref:Mitochondrial protein n=1 Tax=Cardamine amara subsp. amara TaxID=228776 RepID=A0ABD0ZX24_CARAN